MSILDIELEAISFVASDNNKVFRGKYRPKTEGKGTIYVQRETFRDTLGFINRSSSAFYWTYDNTAPSFSITGANTSGDVILDSTATDDEALIITLTCSEIPINFNLCFLQCLQ